MTDTASRVVVLRALGLGDLCTAVPALRALRRHAEHLVLAAPAVLEPLARLAGVDTVTDTGPLQRLDSALHGADLAVNLHGRGPQSTGLLAATGPRRLIAFAHPDVDAPLDAHVPWHANQHEVARWCRLLRASGIDADPTDLALDPPPAEPLAPGAVVVHPGAAAPARRWPADRFAAVLAALIAAGRPVVITGTAAEEELGHCVRDLAIRCDRRSGAPGAVTIAAGRTGLAELAATVAAASLVIANDTGVAHLATAYAVPSVVLFGPTSPAEWGPPAGRHRALWAGRLGDPHGIRLDPGLAQIDVEQVLAAIGEVSGVPA